MGNGKVMDLSKCGGICRGDCIHYAIGVACPDNATYSTMGEKERLAIKDKYIKDHLMPLTTETLRLMVGDLVYGPWDEKSTCEWSPEEIDYDNWQTSCGELFTFNDGGPQYNGFKFCPYCVAPR